MNIQIILLLIIEFIGSRKESYNSAQIATGEMQEQFGLLTIRILLPPTSAGLERVFPSLGFVHSDVRNRLGHEKATKLDFVMRSLLSKEKQS